LKSELVEVVLVESWLFENVFLVSTFDALTSTNAVARLPTFMRRGP
jgi:hypothetical protein